MHTVQRTHATFSSFRQATFLEQLTDNGYVSQFRHGVVHQPIALKRCDDKSARQSRNRQRVGHFENSPAWDLKEVKPKSEAVEQAKEEYLFIFAYLMDFRHWKHSELAKHLQTRKGRVGGDSVKDGGESGAVFAEQGASASQVAVARFLDAISRPPAMAGEASDAVSAFTAGASVRSLQIVTIAGQRMLTSEDKTTSQSNTEKWDLIEEPVFPLERNLLGQPLAGMSIWTT